MADQVTTTKQCKVSTTLKLGNDEITRNFTFDIVSGTQPIKENLIAIKTKFMANDANGPYHYLIQPIDWRDDDDDSAAYECTDVQFEIIEKTVTKLDTGT